MPWLCAYSIFYWCHCHLNNYIHGITRDGSKYEYTYLWPSLDTAYKLSMRTLHLKENTRIYLLYIYTRKHRYLGDEGVDSSVVIVPAAGSSSWAPESPPAALTAFPRSPAPVSLLGPAQQTCALCLTILRIDSTLSEQTRWLLDLSFFMNLSATQLWKF